MIYAYEYLSDWDRQILSSMEPFIDFRYSTKDGMNYWTRHHIIENGKNIYKLKLFSFDRLKKGLICTDFDEARGLSMLLERNKIDNNLEDTYPWLTNYVKGYRENGIYWIAIPVSEYIKYYASNFEQLWLLDFEKIFSYRETK